MSLSQEQINMLKNVPMVFILGKARSGTSLLQNLLDAHPKIIGGPESKFATILYPRFAHIKKWTEANILDFVDKLYLEPLFTTLWKLDRNELKELLLSVKDIADYSLICKIVYYQMRNGKDDLIYISDKNPESILYIDTIEKIFPDVKFVHIVREPRDNVYSQITSFKGRNTKFRAFQWVAFNRIVEKRKKKEPGKILTILYETLVNDTAETMKKVSDFLQIPFEDSMTQNNVPVWLDSHIKRKKIENTDEMIHRNLLKPINTSNVGKWKGKMTLLDQTLTEIITSDYAHKTYGYESGNKKEQVKVSPLSLIKSKIIYYIWQNFTQLKAKSFKVNLLYARLKVKRNKNTPPWEYF